jgi:uncharacterized membrane protein YkgB
MDGLAVEPPVAQTAGGFLFAVLALIFVEFVITTPVVFKHNWITVHRWRMTSTPADGGSIFTA